MGRYKVKRRRGLALRQFPLRIAASAMLLMEVAGLGTAARAKQNIERQRFYARVGPGFMSFDIKTSVRVGGTVVPGAGAHADPIVTPAWDIGYFVVPRVSIGLVTGVPPRITVRGTGSMQGMKLGTLVGGPGLLVANYHLGGKTVRPFIGAGAALVAVLKTHDGVSWT